MADEKTFQCRLMTGQEIVLYQQADSVVLPARDGLVGILANHAPLSLAVGRGKVSVRSAGASKEYKVSGGLAHMAAADDQDLHGLSSSLARQALPEQCLRVFCRHVDSSVTAGHCLAVRRGRDDECTDQGAGAHALVRDSGADFRQHGQHG